MTFHRHKPTSPILAVLGSVSATVARGAHYCDRNADDSAVTMQPSSEIPERIGNRPVIRREIGGCPHYPPPREPSEDDEDEDEDEDSDEDLDDHPEDFDARSDHYARYNDYLRELED